MENNKFTKDDWDELLAKAKSGDAESQYGVASIYEDGFSQGDMVIKADSEQAFLWTKQSYENGSLDGLVRYADHLCSGNFCEKNTNLAITLYEKAIALGSGAAAFNLGVEFALKQDFKTAFKYYELAQRLDFSDHITIGLCYYYGIGTQVDRLKAFQCFQGVTPQNASPYEIDEANYMIGRMYLEGEVIEKAIDKARYHLNLANRDGDHRSAEELLFIIGKNVTENP